MIAQQPQQQQYEQQQPNDEPNENNSNQVQQNNIDQINQNDNNQVQESSSYDQQAIQALKNQVSLTNHQLLELTYNDQKFYQKLKQLNHYGCLYIKKMQYPQALVYLSQAEKVLQYAASCGKTIERKLIIATLNNQASLYQKAWQLEKAESYLQAIIYNISSSFQNNSEFQQQPLSVTRLQQFSKHILDEKSAEYQDFSISLWRKKSLIIFNLQYCAINSQNKNNERAFSSAQKALSLIKQVCTDLYKYEKYLRENHHSTLQHEQHDNQILYQLANFKQLEIKQNTTQKFYNYYKTAVKHIALYIKRMQSSSQILHEEDMQVYKQCFQNYSIGTIMQINPSELEQQVDRLNLKQQITIIQKHFKAIYLSVAHFILGTEARFIASQKYTLDENQRRQSPEFQQSQIYHLCSIIILTKFLLCESGYFDHIVNSFRNHYKVDLMEDARQYLEKNPQIGSQQEDEDEEIVNLFQKEILQQKTSKKSHQPTTQMLEVQEIENLQSEIKTVNQIAVQGGGQNDGPIFNLNTQQFHQYEDGARDLSRDQLKGQLKQLKDKHSGATKSTKLSKNTVCSHGSAKQQKHHDHQHHHTDNTRKQHHQIGLKKVQSKKSINYLMKNPIHHQTSKPFVANQHERKNPQKNINLLTSREKQNKLKPTQLNSNSKASRSKRKSDYQFLSNHKKIHNSHEKITQNLKERTSSKRETIYSKRQSDYIPNKISRSKSKNRRMPTATQVQTKAMRRKDSYGDLRKTKRVEEEYGVSASTSNKYLDINKLQIKTSLYNINSNTNLGSNNLKKSKNRKESEQKNMKLASPDLKLRKLKSPKNIKK